MIRRGAKRKPPTTQNQGIGPGNRKPKSEFTKLPANGYPTEHPFNKDNFRYILAEPDPHGPFRQEFDETSEYGGRPIPGWLYRNFCPKSVLIAMHDRAPQLKVSEDRLTVIGDKGYCMARATHGAHYGSWFYEIKINDMPDGSHVRLGWSQELGNLQGPCGYDKYSYSWRSRKGTKFHDSCGHHFTDFGYGHGDVVGILIVLPKDEDQNSSNKPNYLPPTYKEKPLIKFKSHLYFEEKDDIPAITKKLRPLKGSKIIYFKNGQQVGTAFEDIYSGVYYPAASLYKNVSLTFNFGPNFAFPPTEIGYRPIEELAEDAAIRQSLSDIVYLVENESLHRLDTFYGTVPVTS
ncbi:set1/Ash2 histone methyltransferase complex subunit ASH2-like [Panonychus citri]|uniref:set1/Ash2 histone methyltransferase complex subunit ASH2-like n=1 Tax=Panonychus citri TaxID=50023 RepID=UPI002307D5EC|nr:set1/Ash2 histone methyltransferase complex subunit ASH2-like [Panonychus citri]